MYFKDLSNISSVCELDNAQSAHIATVLRLKEGDEIVLFDGEGLSCKANITVSSKRNAQCSTTLSITSTVSKFSTSSKTNNLIKSKDMSRC
jgi:16S rRNA U1498 N3-methylase RsmE